MVPDLPHALKMETAAHNDGLAGVVSLEFEALCVSSITAEIKFCSNLTRMHGKFAEQPGSDFRLL